MPVTVSTVRTPTTIYTTTSTARPTTTITSKYTTPSRRTTTEDPLQKCNVAGLPTTIEIGIKELEELVKYVLQNNIPLANTLHLQIGRSIKKWRSRKKVD